MADQRVQKYLNRVLPRRRRATGSWPSKKRSTSRCLRAVRLAPVPLQVRGTWVAVSDGVNSGAMLGGSA